MAVLEGKTVLITGGSSGLGRRFAQVLAQNGATVVVVARRKENLDLVVDDIRQRGGSARSFVFDALIASAPEQLMKSLKSEGLVPDILVNAAGINRPGRAETITCQDFDAVFTVNVRAPWQLSQLCAREWIGNAAKGVIVNVSSMLSRRVGLGVSVYAASKAALSHLTAAQAREWSGHGIRVNALSPGYVATEINQDFWKTAAGRHEVEKLPSGRIGQPEDLDSALLFLVDPKSHFVNGTELVIDDAQSWAI